MSARPPFVPTLRRPSLMRRAARRSRRAVPLLVWCACLVAIHGLLDDQVQRTTLPGLAVARTHGVTAPLEARLVELRVEEGDPVRAGAWIAQFDDVLARERLAADGHELDALRAELTLEERRLAEETMLARRELDLTQAREFQRFARDLEDAQVDHQRTSVELEEARVELRGLRYEYDRVRGLVANGVVSELQVVQIATRHDALAERIEELESVLATRVDREEAARARRDEFLTLARPELAPLIERLAPLRHRILAQESVVATRRAELDACRVVAPADGTLGPIQRRPGETLRRGDLVCTVVESRPRELVAYLPVPMRAAVGPDTELTVSLLGRPGERRPARLRSLDGAAVPLPERLWNDPRVEEWGIPLRLEPFGDEIPGQRIEVHLATRPD